MPFVDRIQLFAATSWPGLAKTSEVTLLQHPGCKAFLLLAVR